MKKILGVHSAPSPHWVGDGFPARTLFSYSNGPGKHLSPFLLLDYAGPADFGPSHRPRGVGEHPHRGFETVTIVYQGEVSHRDSTGQGGSIGPGDVQWMTAGSGILHDEFHSKNFTQNGGVLEMVQLWVNLPAKHKMTEPGYQAIQRSDIPTVELADKAGKLRVIAGSYVNHKGPARSFSPMNVWDIHLNKGAKTKLDLPENWNVGLVVLRGTVMVNNSAIAHQADLVVLESAQSSVEIEANNEAIVLLLSGEPIDEPIFGYGPFVMNNREEIIAAIHDFNTGKFGSMKTI